MQTLLAFLITLALCDYALGFRAVIVLRPEGVAYIDPLVARIAASIPVAALCPFLAVK